MSDTELNNAPFAPASEPQSEAGSVSEADVAVMSFQEGKEIAVRFLQEVGAYLDGKIGEVPPHHSEHLNGLRGTLNEIRNLVKQHLMVI